MHSLQHGIFANQGALIALTEDDDAILCDRENHASIMDGCQFAPAKLIPFRHNSASSLEMRLKRLPDEAGRLVIMDGVFSMSGDIADLPEIIPVAKRHGATVYVDEAHSLGSLAAKGAAPWTISASRTRWTSSWGRFPNRWAQWEALSRATAAWSNISNTARGV